MNGTPAYTPFPEQQQVHHAGTRYLVIAAGRRGGKTRCLAAEFLWRIIAQWHAAGCPDVPTMTRSTLGRRVRPALHYWVVAPTYDLLKEPYRFLLDDLGGQNSPMILTYDGVHHELWLRGPILIEWKSAEHPERLVSVGVHGLWLTEAAKMREETWARVRPTLADHTGWLLSDSTPEGPNWWYTQLWRPGHPGSAEWRSFKWPTTANPHTRAEALAARATMPPAYYRREWEADFTAFAGAVYSQLERATIQLAEPQRLEWDRAVAGIDWGYSTPGALVVAVRVRIQRERYGLAQKTWYVVEAHQQTGAQVHEYWLPRLLEAQRRWRLDVVRCDPSRPEHVNDLRRAGIPAMGAHGQIAWGIATISGMFHREELRLCLPACTELLRDLQTYRWADPRPGHSEEPAPGQNDHLPDALRYALAEEVQGPGVWALPRDTSATSQHLFT